MDNDGLLAHRIAETLYGQGPQIEPLSRRNNAVFRLRFPDRCAILKLAKTTDQALIRKELMLIARLKGHGVPVPVVAHADAEMAMVGRPFFVMDSAGDETVADGITRPTAAAGPLLTEMGSVLARIHGLTLEHSGDISADGIRPRDADDKGRRLAHLADWCVEQKLLGPEEVVPFKALPMPPLDGFQLCHGDFHAVQCVVADGRITAVVDWQSAWAGNPAIDLAVTHAYLDYYCPFELIRCFFAGYTSLTPLPNDYDRAFLAVRMAQALGLLRVWHRLGHEPSARRAVELYRAYAARLRGPGAADSSGPGAQMPPARLDNMPT